VRLAAARSALAREDGGRPVSTYRRRRQPFASVPQAEPFDLRHDGIQPIAPAELGPMCGPKFDSTLFESTRSNLQRECRTHPGTLPYREQLRVVELSAGHVPTARSHC